MRFALGFPLLLQLADAVHHFERGVASLCGMAGLFEGRTPEGHHSVADVLIKCSLMIENQAGHVGKILI